MYGFMSTGLNFITVIKREANQRKQKERALLIVPALLLFLIFFVSILSFFFRVKANKSVTLLKSQVQNYRKKVISLTKLEAQEYYYYLQTQAVVEAVKNRPDLITLFDKAIALADQPNRDVQNLNIEDKSTSGGYTTKSLVDILQLEVDLKKRKDIVSFVIGGLDETVKLAEDVYNFLLKLKWK